MLFALTNHSQFPPIKFASRTNLSFIRFRLLMAHGIVCYVPYAQSNEIKAKKKTATACTIATTQQMIQSKR